MPRLHEGHSVGSRVFIFPPQLVEASGNEQARRQVIDEMLAAQQLPQGRVRCRVDEAQCMVGGMVGVEPGIQSADVLYMKKAFAGIQPAAGRAAASGTETFDNRFVDVIFTLMQVAQGQVKQCADIFQ